MTDFRDTRFSSAQTAKAASIKPTLLHTWMRRYFDAIDDRHQIEGGGTRGHDRTFSYYDVMNIALAARLVDVGVPVVDALKAGACFAYTYMNIPGYRREPGMPFHDAKRPPVTLVIVSPKGPAVVPYDRQTDPFKEINILLGNPDAFTVFPVHACWIDVCVKLGFVPSDVLNAAYEEAD